jgi:hypothetical protein
MEVLKVNIVYKFILNKNTNKAKEELFFLSFNNGSKI